MIADPTCTYTLPQAVSWVEMSNDSEITTRDDLLTAQAAAHLAGDGWQATVEYRMETVRPAHARTDQLGIAIGPSLTVGTFAAEVGAGVLVDGNLGGSKVQARWHHIEGGPRIRCRYGDSELAPLAVVAARWTLGPVEPRCLVGVGRAVAIVPSVAVGDEHVEAIVGYALSYGHDCSAVADAVARDMRGLSVSVGGTFGHVAASVTLSGRALTWSIGSVF